MTEVFHILLVEDDDIDVKTVQRAFKQNHLTNRLDVVGDGEQALAYLRKEAPFQDALKPGIILLDLQMPRMNGHEFLKIAKSDQQLRRIPVVVLTTSQQESDRFESFDLGVAGYLVKPVDFEKFVHVVKILTMYWTLSEGPPCAGR